MRTLTGGYNDPVNYVDLLGLDPAVATQFIQEAANIHPALALIPIAAYVNYYTHTEIPRAIGETIGETIKRTLPKPIEISVDIDVGGQPGPVNYKPKEKPKPRPEPETKVSPQPKQPEPEPDTEEPDEEEDEVILYRAVTPQDNKEFETEGIIKSWALRAGLDPQAHLDNIGEERMFFEHSIDSRNVKSSFISTTPYITQTHKYRLPPTRRVFVMKVPESRITENYINAEPESLIFGMITNKEILGYIENGNFVENAAAIIDFADYVKIEQDIVKLNSCGD